MTWHGWHRLSAMGACFSALQVDADLQKEFDMCVRSSLNRWEGCLGWRSMLLHAAAWAGMLTLLCFPSLACARHTQTHPMGH